MCWWCMPPLSLDPAGWWGVLLGGSVGAVIGTVASVSVALIVVQRQAKHNRDLALDDQRRELLLELLRLVAELRSAGYRLAGRPSGDEDIWDYYQDMLDLKHRVVY